MTGGTSDVDKLNTARPRCPPEAALTAELDVLLSSLTPAGNPREEPNPAGGDAAIFIGEVVIDLNQNKSPLPGFDFHLGLPTEQATGEAASQPAPSLLVYGSAEQPASMRFTPDTDSTEGIVTLGFDTPAVVFGTSSVGFVCPTFIIDDSALNAGRRAGRAWPRPAACA